MNSKQGGVRNGERARHTPDGSEHTQSLGTCAADVCLDAERHRVRQETGPALQQVSACLPFHSASDSFQDVRLCFSNLSLRGQVAWS